MFVFPDKCSDFPEWLEKNIEATAQWSANCKSAIVCAIELDRDYIERALTAYRAEAMFEMLKDVEQAYSAFQSK